jgi:hypothetical protein
MKAGRIFIVGLSWVVVMGWGIAAMAQAPDTLWTRTYGGQQDDIGYCIKQTTDGGYIIAGITSSFGVSQTDAYLVKIDDQGDTLWTKTFGDSLIERFYSVDQTNDGGYVAAGSTNSFGAGSGDFYIVRTDAEGNLMWTKIYGTIASDVACTVQQTADGGYFVVGNTYINVASDIYFVKMDSLGDSLWSRIYGGDSDDFPQDAQQTTDGGYVITGRTRYEGIGNYDYSLWKVDCLGEIQWHRHYGGNENDPAYCVDQTSDGGYIMAGFAYMPYTAEDVYIVKTNDVGDTLWTRLYVRDEDECIYDIQQTGDMGYILIGYTMPIYPGNMNLYVLKCNPIGHLLWTGIYGGLNAEGEKSVIQTSDESYIFAGFTASFGARAMDIFVIRTEPDTMETRPQIDVSEYTLNFGLVPIYELDSLSLIIYNFGDTTLAVYGIYTSSPCFTTNFSPQDSLIFPNGSSEITVYFAPAETMAYTEMLSIENNDSLLQVNLLGITEGYNEVKSRLSLKMPDFYKLNSAIPNPFNQSTTISYEVPVRGRVRVYIYNILGQEVATVTDGVVNPGSYSVVWEAKELSSGIYFIRMEAGEFVQTRKVALLK